MLSCHDGRDKWGCDVGKALVRSNNGCGRVGFIVIGGLEFFGRIWIVVLVRVGGQCAQPNGDAGRLEVGRIERNNSDNIVVVGL